MNKGVWRESVLAFLLFLGVALVIYGPLLNGGMINDDYLWCHYAALVGPLGNDHSLGAVAAFWRPFLSIVFWVLWKIFGISPPAFRLFNILLVAVTAYAIRAIWLRLSPRRDRDKWAALAAGLIFVVWPTHPESVTWIAGMTDTLAICMSALGLWAYIVCRQTGRGRYFIATLILFSLALLSKEAALPIPVISFLALSILIPWRKSGWRLAVGNLLCLLGTTVAYIIARGLILRHFVGGYSNQASFHLIWSALVGDKFLVNLGHAYFPIDQVAPQHGISGFDFLVRTIMTFGVAIMIWKIPRTRPLSLLPQVGVYGVAALFAYEWLATVLFLPVQFVIAMVESLGLLRMAILVLFLLGLAVAYGRWKAVSPWPVARARMSALLARIDPDHHPSTLALVLSFLLITILWFGSADQTAQSGLALLYLAATYLGRPLVEDSKSGAEEGAYARLALVFIGCSLIALVPPLIADLPVNLEGQWMRWAFAATLFSAIALVAWFRCVLGSRPSTRWVAGFGFAALLYFLAPNWLAWRQAEAVAKNTTELIGSILPARRIYVLAAPGTLNGAGVYGIGMPYIPEVARGDHKADVVGLYQLLNFRSADVVQVDRLGQGHYRVLLGTSGAVPRLSPLTTTYYGDWQQFFSVNGNDVHLRGYDPRHDRVILVDNHGAVRLD